MSAGLTVLHISDFQCGKPYLPRATEALLEVFAEVTPDVVVASGDLTQRAKKREFVQARSILDRFGDTPTVITPGNHDVPLYRMWERLFDPFRNWRSFAGEDALDTVTQVGDAVIVALNSAAPRRAIVNGRIDDDQVEFARRAFAQSDAGALRVLVVHHHFVPVPNGEGAPPLPHSARLAQAFGEMGVDVVLGGHVHQLHMHVAEEIPGVSPRVPPLPILACGTSTSRRGRGVEAGWNSLSVLRFAERAVEVTPYRRAPEADAFEAMPAQSWALRRGLGAVT